MAQQNLSERKKKLRKKEKNNHAKPVTTGSAEQKLSRDARRKLRASESEVVKTPEPETGKKHRIHIVSNGLTLKVLLLLTTAVGIAGIVFYNPNTMGRQVLKGVGMAGLPIAVFLLTEGYYHTKSRFKYAGRILLWGLIAQLPFAYLVTYDDARNQNLREGFKEMTEQEQFNFLLEWREAPLLNYLFTLLFAFLFICLFDLINRYMRKAGRAVAKMLLYGSILILVIAVGVLLGGIAQTIKLLESPVLAVMLALLFVLLRERREVAALAAGIAGVTFGLLWGPSSGQLFVGIGAGLPAILLAGYTGKRGINEENHPFVKYGFYIAYAVIISVLVTVGMVVYIKTHTAK